MSTWPSCRRTAGERSPNYGSSAAENLPAGYQETINWGMIAYQVPLERCPDTYNKQPLMYAALTAQKNHNAIYLTCIDQDEAKLAELKEAFAKAGKSWRLANRACASRKRRIYRSM